MHFVNKIKFFLIFALIFASMGITGCAKKDKKVNKIVVWHWMTDRDDAFIELANKYKEAFGVEVAFELYAPSEAYSSKVKAAAQTNTLPDIFGVLSEKRDFASFIKAGHVENLSPYMEAEENLWKNRFFQKGLLVNEFGPQNQYGVQIGIYGVPIDVTNIQLLYNKKMFKEAGLDPLNPPTTWAEFLEAGRKLKAKNLQGIVSGFSEIWLLECLVSNYAYNIMGEAKYLDTLAGKVKYTDADWLKVLRLFVDLRDNNLLATGVVSMVNKTAEQMFANERAAIALDGSWCVNVYHGMNPNLEYGVMYLPVYNQQNPMPIWGGAGSSFVVNAKSSQKEEAIKFLKWLTDKEQQIFLADTTRNLPVNKESLENIPPILDEFANDMEKTIHPSNFSVAEYSSVTEVLDKGIQSIIIGEKTPEQVAAEVQSVKDKELTKAV